MADGKVDQIGIDRALEKLLAEVLKGSEDPKAWSKIEELQADRRRNLVPSKEKILMQAARFRHKASA